MTAIALGDNTTVQPYMLLEARETENTCTVHSRTSNPLTFEINQSEKMRITAGGLVGIGTDNPSKQLSIYGDSDTCIRVTAALGGAASLQLGDIDDTVKGAITFLNSDNSLRIRGHNNTDRVIITSSGEVLIGHTAAFGHSGVDGHLQLAGTGTDDTSITQTRFSNDAWCPFISMAKSRNGTIGSHTVVQNNDYLGYINFAGSDGTDFNNGAAFIAALVDGTPGTDDMPGRFIFATSAAGTNSPTERMRITSGGDILLNKGNNQNTILSNTSDASDSQSVFVGGGGGASDSRGAYIWAKGNEYTTTGGYLQLNAGNVGSAPITFSTAGSEKLRIDSSGRLLIGTTSDSADVGASPLLQVEDVTGSPYGRISIAYNLSLIHI